MSMNFQDMVAALAKPGEDILATLTPERVNLWHVATGVAGEAGEVLDLIKKYVAYGQEELDLDKLVKELGDVEFYLEALRQAVGVSREYVLQKNIEKLAERYEGFQYSDAQAVKRVDVEQPSFLVSDQVFFNAARLRADLALTTQVAQ